MKEQGKVIMAKCGAELACKLIHLNKHLNDVANLASKMSHLKKPSNDNANVHPPPNPTDPPVESPKKSSSPLESIGHASTSSPPIPPENRTHEPTPLGSPIPPEDSTKDPTPSPPPISPKESTKGPILPKPSPKESTKGLIPLKPSGPSYLDDIPSFDLFKPDEPEFEDVCAEGSRSPTPTSKHSDFFIHHISFYVLKCGFFV